MALSSVHHVSSLLLFNISAIQVTQRVKITQFGDFSKTKIKVDAMMVSCAMDLKEKSMNLSKVLVWECGSCKILVLVSLNIMVLISCVLCNLFGLDTQASWTFAYDINLVSRHRLCKWLHFTRGSRILYKQSITYISSLPFPFTDGSLLLTGTHILLIICGS